MFCLSEPEVEKHLQDTAGKEGQSCSLSCQLSIPNVDAQWFRNGKQLEMKGRFTSEVKHKVQKLLIRDLKPEDQGRYSCRYQDLESSADLWVEGLYLEAFLLPCRRGGCSHRILTSFDSSNSETNAGHLDFSFFSFFWDLSSCFNLLHDYLAQNKTSVISFIVVSYRLKSTDNNSRRHNHPINIPLTMWMLCR